MKVADLQGALLDYWVARAAGLSVSPHQDWVDGAQLGSADGTKFNGWYSPTQDWAECGPLIEQFDIDVYQSTGNWYADCRGTDMVGCGQTPQEAICRAVVAKVYGAEVPK